MDELAIRPVEGQGSVKPVDHFKSTNAVRSRKVYSGVQNNQSSEDTPAITDLDIAEW